MSSSIAVSALDSHLGEGGTYEGATTSGQSRKEDLSTRTTHGRGWCPSQQLDEVACQSRSPRARLQSRSCSFSVSLARSEVSRDRNSHRVSSRAAKEERRESLASDLDTSLLGDDRHSGSTAPLPLRYLAIILQLENGLAELSVQVDGSVEVCETRSESGGVE